MNSMKLDEILTRLEYIGTLENSEDKIKEIDDLLKEVNKPKIKISFSGNYAYFYPYQTKYDSTEKKTKYILGKSLGKISKKIYLENKKQFDKMSIKELSNALQRSNQ